MYLALFNLGHFSSAISTSLTDMMQQLDPGASNSPWKCEVVDGWSGKSLGLLIDTISVVLPRHSSTLYVLKCTPHYFFARSFQAHEFAYKTLTVVTAVVSLGLLYLVVTSLRDLADTGGNREDPLHLSHSCSLGRARDLDDNEPLL